MKKNLIALVGLSLASPLVMATEWFALDIGEEKMLQMNVSDIKKIDSTYTNVWIAEVNIDKSLLYDLLLNLYRIDCHEDRLRTIQTNFYLGGKFIHKENGIDEWSYPIPNSIGGEIINIGCKRYMPEKEIVNFSSLEELRNFDQEFMTILQSPTK